MKFTPHSTKTLKPATVERKWLLLDAKGKRIGTVATKAALLLRGKHKTDFTPHVDCGDFVVIINTKEMDIPLKKMEQKTYYRHSGYRGHLKEETLGERLTKHPDRVLEDAISGMLSKNRLRKPMMQRLKLYPGADHHHAANAPQAMTF